MAKVIATVCGEVAVEQIGPTLPHEHVLTSADWAGQIPGPEPEEQVLDSVELALEKLRLFRQVGGSCIVDVTPRDLRGRVEDLRFLSENSEVHIVCSTGWYTEEYIPRRIVSLSRPDRAAVLVEELTNGIRDSRVRAGAIKVGCSDGLHEQERLNLLAAIDAQRETGAPLLVHITNYNVRQQRFAEKESTLELVGIMKEEGADLSRVCLCHMDGDYYDPTVDLRHHRKLLETGVFLEYDQFATVVDPGHRPDKGVTPNEIRLQGIASLCKEGFTGQLLISHDISSKRQLLGDKFGCDYTYLFTTAPAVLESMGAAQQTWEQLVQSNPKRLFGLEPLPRAALYEVPSAYQALKTEKTAGPAAGSAYKPRFPSLSPGEEPAWFEYERPGLSHFEPGLDYFSRKKATLLQHRSLADAEQDLQQNILVYSLFSFLDFTDWLETEPIHEACELIRSEPPGLIPWIPREVRLDARYIDVDEEIHARMCRELVDAVVRTTGLSPLPYRPAGRTRLHRLVSAQDPGLASLLVILFAFVSETTITPILSEVQSDQNVQKPVRALLRAHAKDEAHHHRYFRQFFGFLWGGLSVGLRIKLGALLPEVMLCFLEPDWSTSLDMLLMFPREFSDPRRIVEEWSTLPVTHDAFRRGARPTLKILEANGLFKDRRILRAFRDSGLIGHGSGEESGVVWKHLSAALAGTDDLQKDRVIWLLSTAITSSESVEALGSLELAELAKRCRSWLRRVSGERGVRIAIVEDGSSEKQVVAQIEDPGKFTLALRFVQSEELDARGPAFVQEIFSEIVGSKSDYTALLICSPASRFNALRSLEELEERLPSQVIVVDAVWAASILVQGAIPPPGE